MTESIHSLDNQTKILMYMLPHVAFEGWTQGALEKAVVAAGFNQADCFRAFGGNPSHVIDFFFEWINDNMEQQLKLTNICDLKISKRIEHAVLTRLNVLAPYKEAMRQTMRWLAHPIRLPLNLKFLYHSVDRIWYSIGDTSVDFSFYTKRASLAAVYSATMLKWLTDQSWDQSATRVFLKNRLDNVMQFHRAKHKVKHKIKSLIY